MKATKQGQDIAGRLDKLAGDIWRLRRTPLGKLDPELSRMWDEIYELVDKVYMLDERGRKT